MIISGETRSTVSRGNRGRVVAVAGCLVTASLLAACGGSSSGSTAAAGSSATGSGTTGSSGTVSSPAGSASSTPSVSLTPATLAARLQAGAKGITSAHITLTTALGGKSLVSAQGDETLAAGKLVNMDLSEQVSGMTIGLRLVGSSVYAKLPAGAGGSAAKPWVRADATSSNPVLKGLASGLASARDSGSLSSYGAFAQVASSIKDAGPATVAGIATEHYRLMLDSSKLSAINPSAGGLAKAGIGASIPVDLWIDTGGRPVQFVMTLTAQGQTVVSKVLVTKFNAPVTITAPPADQLAN